MTSAETLHVVATVGVLVVKELACQTLGIPGAGLEVVGVVHRTDVAAVRVTHHLGEPRLDLVVEDHVGLVKGR